MRRKISLAFGFVLMAFPALSAQLPATTAFKIVPLVSNQTGKAPNVDPNLVNPWGLAQAPGKSPIWAADNGTGLSTVYEQGTGKIDSIVVTIPKGQPTGTVYAPAVGFKITENGKSGDSAFIFDSATGVLSGWNSSVDANNAVIAVDNSGNGSVYTGLALDPSTKLLFAANIANNQVQVFDNKWNQVAAFTDTGLPAGFAPFNVAIFNGNVYVTFAQQGGFGPSGYVDVFNESGTLLQQLIAKGKLNGPWGMAKAPSTFGSFAGSLLVGNLYDGKINAYDAGSGSLLGTLSNKRGKPIKIQGLWALDPVPRGDITFSAGPNFYADGMIGLIKVAK
ncbi:MAG TPA: TIGR03118 family protein [Rhizomicrobium sp.]|jgi:uncharacterized protein (TIGR03118 family)